MRRAPLGLAALVALASACAQTIPPRQAEVLVTIDTDAPLALADGEVLELTTATPLFDRVRIEVLDAASGALACSACSNDFSVDRTTLARGQLSVGIVPDRPSLLVRARLFRGASVHGGEPAPGSTIDRIVTLPRVVEGDLHEITVPLLLDRVGVVADPSQPESPLEGHAVVAKLRDGVAYADCTAPGGPGQVCVPGGAYWMSNALYGVETNGTESPERVAIISPFWLDAAELSVADARASKVSLASVKVGKGTPDDCTFTAAPGPNEALPLTCVSWETASKLCEARGGRLPTEGELELVAGGRRSRARPWGDDDPACQDAVLARVDPALHPDEVPFFECAALGPGAKPHGSAMRDALMLPTGTLTDLLGNVKEWALDDGEELGVRCWKNGLVVDPRCTVSPANGVRAIRGRSYFAQRSGSNVRARVLEPGTAVFGDVGLRCARPGR